MSPEEARVDDTIAKLGPLPAFRQLTAENDALIRGPTLDNGRAIAAARSAIYTGLVRDWAAEQQRTFGYDKPFAVVALGGTGRAEMTPHSDNDFAFLFADALEANPFLLELQRQVLHSDAFERRCGFTCLALPFSLDDVPRLADKQLNAFLDLRPIHDPQGLADQFRERIRSTYDPFQHFLHVRGFWKGEWEKAAGESERLDRFDIKHEGLRLFLAGIWTLAGKDFSHSHEIYRALDDHRDLDAYAFLLRIRAFIHSRRAGGKPRVADGHHPEDVLGFDDFTSFGELLGPGADERACFEFANDVRARLLAARRRVARFAKAVIERELKLGRAVSLGSPIVCGTGGLYHRTAEPARTPREKSRAALSLLLAAQHYGVPIDPSELQTTFRNAGDWLERVPELSALFYEPRGSLADSFQFLAQIEGAEERLFAGYAKFESSLDGRVVTERRSLRGALERQKTRALEAYVREGRSRLARAFSPSRADPTEGISVEVEAALLDADHLAGVKLALKTKRLPLTTDDVAVRDDPSRPLHERLSTGLSGIPLADYYRPYATECEFSLETIRVAEFLVAHRRAFKEAAEAGMNDARQVDDFVQLSQDEHLLRSLFVFTSADRVEWESEASDPTRWFNTRELYAKAMMRFRSPSDHTRLLRAAGYTSDQLRILRDFGVDFFSGVYRPYANRFGSHLVRMVEEPDATGPKASLLRDGRSTLVGVAARDYRGLAASISGALWHSQIELRQAHLFSAMNHGLALDFFHLAPRDQPLRPDLTRFLEEVIRERRFIHESDEATLPTVTGHVSLQEWRPGQFCLRFESTRNSEGLIYALTYRVFRHLRGNIFGLSAQARPDRAYISVYLSLPRDLSPASARDIVGRHF
ncbi:MAG: hypothetical protein KJ072_19250 [Verrucomicrobia bacterium]|nr:hypothetical protein [Verrucomicrobiota bacterium]